MNFGQHQQQQQVPRSISSEPPSVPSEELQPGSSKQLQAEEEALVHQEAAVLDPRSLECPVCLQLLHDPHVGRCGHTYCLRCIEDLARFDQKCPLCRRSLGRIEECPPNVLVRSLIERHFPEAAAQRRAQALESPNAANDGLKLVLRRASGGLPHYQQHLPDDEPPLNSPDSALTSLRRVARAAVPLLHQLMPIAYDLIVVFSFVSLTFRSPENAPPPPHERFL